MKWKQIKADASGVAALFVGGAAILLLTFLSLPSHQIRLGRGGLDVSRETHPALYWACEGVVVLAGVVCLVLGVRLLRSLIRQQRNQERNLEQQAIDSFIRDHEKPRH
jgi:hypothetical protein